MSLMHKGAHPDSHQPVSKLSWLYLLYTGQWASTRGIILTTAAAL